MKFNLKGDYEGSGEVRRYPLVVSNPAGGFLFRITEDGRFEWGDGIEPEDAASEAGRILAETFLEAFKKGATMQIYPPKVGHG